MRGCRKNASCNQVRSTKKNSGEGNHHAVQFSSVQLKNAERGGGKSIYPWEDTVRVEKPVCVFMFHLSGRKREENKLEKRLFSSCWPMWGHERAFARISNPTWHWMQVPCQGMFRSWVRSIDCPMTWVCIDSESITSKGWLIKSSRLHKLNTIYRRHLQGSLPSKY